MTSWEPPLNDHRDTPVAQGAGAGGVEVIIARRSLRLANVRVAEWQTPQLEVLVPREGRAGSSPASDTAGGRGFESRRGRDARPVTQRTEACNPG
jgi:hypothetical protein